MRWLMFAAVLLLAGCRTVEYVPVESVRTEFRDRAAEAVRVDSVTQTQFVFVKGDTVVDIRERERVRYVERHDTVFCARVDSVRVERPVYVEKAMRWHEQGCLWLGRLCVAAFVLWCGVRWVRRK